MWVIADYQSVSLFSLKSALATSSGGKSLLVPTPYALKMGLLDAVYRVFGAGRARDCWPILRDLRVAMDLPEQVVVTNLFTKILKPRRGDAAEGSSDAGPYQKTIAFREYVWSKGTWRLALGSDLAAGADLLPTLLLHLTYVGKRGGLIQLLRPPQAADALGREFTLLNPSDGQEVFQRDGVLQILDDCGPKMTLAQADVYSGKRVSLGKERLLNHVVLPYTLVQASRGYTLYERLPPTSAGA